MIDVDALIAAGWVYRDFTAWVRESTWDWLFEQIGAGNFHVLAGNRRTDWPDGPWMRGQILISPDGRARLANADTSKCPGLDRPTPETRQ